MPRPILADEPTSALDPRQKAAALAGLSALAQKGAAVVLVSHDRAMLGAFLPSGDQPLTQVLPAPDR